jgi:tetratricopeptide (TPR) repeat protein
VPTNGRPLPPEDAIDEDSFDRITSWLVGLRMARERAVDYLLDAAEFGPKLFPQIVRGVAPGLPVEPIYRGMALWVADHLPLPAQRFAARKLARPGRNEPCLCGSGLKYKHCCAEVDGLAQMPPINLLPYVLDRLSIKDFAQLVGSQVDLHAVADCAHDWTEHGRADLACKLLEPWFKQAGTLPGRYEVLFDTLADAYLANGNPRKKERLVAQAIERGDSAMRSAGYQRLATLHSDAGRGDEAFAAFREAQRLTPNAPSLAHLEVLLLLSGGEVEQAKARARFWLARVPKLGVEPDSPLIAFLEATLKEGEGAFASFSRDRVPGLDRLRALLDAAPPVRSLYAVRAVQGVESLIAPAPELARAEVRWREVFEQEKPMLTATQIESSGAWARPQPWLDALAAEPLLWQSFEALDDLVLATESLQVPGDETFIVLPLLERAAALFDAMLPEATSAGAQLPWGCVDNRPALRLLARRAFILQHTGRSAQARVAMARLVALNPTDNQGLRGPLARLHLEAGDARAALDLLDRYPADDLVATPMNRALALHRLGRDAEARRALAAAHEQNAHAIRMLVAAKPRQPALSPFGITCGGPDEAWFYREEHRATWEAAGALAWLEQAAAALAGLAVKKRAAAKPARGPVAG